jgi:ADP-heptose:LPS heptosyltransferase
MNVLVIRFSSIGDIVLTSPVVRCLKQQVEGVQIHYLTKTAYRPLVATNPHIDHCHFLEDENLIVKLRLENFDHLIDLHHNVRTLRIKRALKVPSTSFPKLNIQKWILTAFKINILPKVHIVDRYMETVAALGVKNDGNGLDYFIPKADEVTKSDLPLSHSAGYIGIVIGAALGTKKLPRHKLQELCRQIQHPLVLLGGAEDKVEGDLIASVDPIKVYNACGKFNLHESADLVRGAKLVISHDTGLMHIAAAFQKPILSIWGNTVPAFGMAPYYGARSKQTAQSFEVRPLYCRPCSKIGFDRCPLGHFKCMERQNIEKIVEAIHTR